MSKQDKKTIGNGNRIIYSVNDLGESYDKDTIVTSWKVSYSEKISREQNEKGLRAPQFGAISAIRAHWIVSNAPTPATVVMPTGTGKTETIFTTIISERIRTTLIIVPSDLLRKQIFEGASHFGILPDLGMISSEGIFPNCMLYKSRVKKDMEEDFLKELNNANIIVSTPKMIKNMPEIFFESLIDNVELVVFDEAHHLAAPDWKNVRERFLNKKILQFTATPYRNDGKKLEGKIIFNYSLGLAQLNGYFKPIDFYPIQEFEEKKSDKEIAKMAINLLSKDIKEELNHVLLARAKNRDRAEYLFDEIYSKYHELNPVIIHSGRKKSENIESLEKVKKGESKVIVCVDMFGEGIDIPALKIAAIHDKYKSLPITLQFIGRFARTGSGNIGNAKLVTNIAMDDLKEGIEDLYHQDSDWNQLLHLKSNTSVEKEVELGEFISKFQKGHVDAYDLSQLKMKISTRMFEYRSKKIAIDNWKNILDFARTYPIISEEESVYIFIEELEDNVVWSEQKDIIEYGYNFFVIFYDRENGIIHINETDEGKGRRLVEAIFENAKQITGEPVYRILKDINRLMIGTLGLKQVPSGRMSFRMFAGTDVKAGISEAIVSGSIKSNLFGYGFQDGNKISVGCSYKGKVWMRWVEKINFWIEWCRGVSKKVLDDTIDTSDILENSLMMEPINEFPEGVPYKICFPEEIETSNSVAKTLFVGEEEKSYPFYQAELRCPEIIDGNLRFQFWINERKYEYEQFINDSGYGYTQITGRQLFVKQRSGLTPLEDYFKDYSPEITFIQEDGSVIMVQENLKVLVKQKKNLFFPNESLVQVDWSKYKVDIKKESQDRDRKKDTIQYATIHNLVDQNSTIIFDDDGSGEIADVVSIKADIEMRKLDIFFYHCKYSHGKSPGSRIADLYEVCGQAEKSIMWNSNVVELIKRMIFRENQRQTNFEDTRIELGNIELLYAIEKMVKSGFETELKIAIVQPGVSIAKISSEMNQLLLATDSYLKETYGLDLICYFSK
ncbi:TPA: DEAD/DEAH box helicase family protein [Enterococcus faecalis]|nr:DEAD/DEAH box helicase family protein [Enterococcus faecalis]HBI1785698.1 DEAD/DEAH box helicase family protein [Enterococcus faecalis]HBI1790973.1 DEAD/DEAH box helicase family protein [Enterococcus faecalis]HBI1886765.1 DEAD/DEAH box helicase family protein [Enterococcus faecalis]HBI1897606.1 DEAD/DEAH box helicase family protein [Enterococcus faecalis]